MKKFGLLTMLGILSVSACTGISEIENPEETVKKEVTIKVSHEYDGQTKTVLQEDGSVWWKPSDAIGVFFGTYCSWFHAYNMEDAPTANFIGEAIVIQGHTENSNGNSGTYTYWGVFPPDMVSEESYDEDDFDYWTGNEDYEEPTREKESVNVFLPAKQKGVAGTFDSFNFISIARNTTYEELYFYNLCGGLAFCVEKEGIHTVTFKGNSDEVLAGGVNVVMNSDSRPVVNEVRNGKTEVKLSMPEGEYFVPGEWYYIVMLPASLEKGYSMTFYTDREMGTVVSSKPVEIKRSVFGKLTNPDSGVEYTEFVPVESIDIQRESYSSEICVGDTLALTAVITPSDCTFPAVWSSSDPSVATVDENGNVIGLSEGETRIVLTVGDMSDYMYLYVYPREEEEEEEEEVKIPSFKITSVDLTDVYAITDARIDGEFYDDYYGQYDYVYALHTVSDNGTMSPLKFNFTTDDVDFEKFVKDSVVFTAYNVRLLTDKYLVIGDMSCTYNQLTAPKAYCAALSFASMYAIRLKDGAVLEMEDYPFHNFDWLNIGTWNYQNTYYSARAAYDTQSVFFIDINSGFAITTEKEDRIVVEHRYGSYVGSQFSPNTDMVIIDKDNNLLTSDRSDIGYVLCNDNSIIPFNVQELVGYDPLNFRFFEVDYTWYLWCGSHREDGHCAYLYKATIENNQLVFTELISEPLDQSVTFMATKYYRRGNMFIFGLDGQYQVINIDNMELSCVNMELPQDYYADITPDGYYYIMENNVLYKYDLLSGESTTITTDRSQVPPMTPTSPSYDGTNHCYYESGTRLSDSVTITIVTDAETGKVMVYEGSYENSDIYVRLP